MNLMQNKVLVIILGSYNVHIQNFLSNICSYNSNIIFDILTREQLTVPLPILDNTRKQFEIPKCRLSVPIINNLGNLILFVLYIWKLSRKEKYDSINIHYPECELGLVTKLLYKMSPNLIITPWGSDVYRVDRYRKKILNILFDKANIVTLPSTRFGQDVKKMFHLSDNKIKVLSLGSITIDYFINNSNRLTTDEAKTRMGIKGKYAITIGYNSQKGQNHLSIIRAISEVKHCLPPNYILLFPMTYGECRDYINVVKEEVVALNLEAMFFEDFLDLEDLLVLRNCTDVFIHMQATDANNSSLKEYLYFDKLVLNARWLRYEQIERYNPINYILVDDYIDMAQKLVSVSRVPNTQTPPDLKKEIEKTGYSFLAPQWVSFYNDLSIKN